MLRSLLNEHSWRKSLGLFPMPLFDNNVDEKKFILLNGGSNGNLCIDFDNKDPSLARNYAWSSDTSHYLIIDKDNVNVLRWDSYDENKYKVSEVINKLNSFYDYLKKQDINKHDSIIKFSLQLFRQIRNLLRDNIGHDSLNALLLLFACISDDINDRDKIQLEKWAISDSTKVQIYNQIKILKNKFELIKLNNYKNYLKNHFGICIQQYNKN